MTSVWAGHIILTPTQPVGRGRPQRESNPGPPHQESHALPTELPTPVPRRYGLDISTADKKHPAVVLFITQNSSFIIIKNLGEMKIVGWVSPRTRKR